MNARSCGRVRGGPSEKFGTADRREWKCGGAEGRMRWAWRRSFLRKFFPQKWNLTSPKHGLT